MTSVLERIDLESIDRQAREVHFRRTLLTIIASVLFGLGWCIAKVFGLLWLAMAWSAVAIREGWREGRKARAGPSG